MSTPRECCCGYYPAINCCTGATAFYVPAQYISLWPSTTFTTVPPALPPAPYSWDPGGCSVPGEGIAVSFGPLVTTLPTGAQVLNGSPAQTLQCEYGTIVPPEYGGFIYAGVASGSVGTAGQCYWVAAPCGSPSAPPCSYPPPYAGWVDAGDVPDVPAVFQIAGIPYGCYSLYKVFFSPGSPLPTKLSLVDLTGGYTCDWPTCGVTMECTNFPDMGPCATPSTLPTGVYPAYMMYANVGISQGFGSSYHYDDPANCPAAPFGPSLNLISKSVSQWAPFSHNPACNVAGNEIDGTWGCYAYFSWPGHGYPLQCDYFEIDYSVTYQIGSIYVNLTFVAYRFSGAAPMGSPLVNILPGSKDWISPPSVDVDGNVTGQLDCTNGGETITFVCTP